MKKHEVSNKPQIKSKKRVADHGEVFTAEREVNAMLGLVKQETERIDSRFLEPACGTGNFLVEILKRKLDVVRERYGKSQLEYECYAILAISSIYGIDLLEDNVIECRKRLMHIFETAYTDLFKGTFKNECIESARFILDRNILHGDALTLLTVGNKPSPIVFSEWSAVNGSMMKRRDFEFSHLIECAPLDGHNLFSDLGEDVFIPTPIKDFPVQHFLRLEYENE